MTKRLLFLSATLFTPAAIWSQTAVAQNGWQVFNLGGSTKLDGQSGPVVGRPLSANEVRTTTQTLGDGSHITHSETERFYRDGYGRMRTETETGAVIYDPVSGFTYDLTFGRKSFTKSPNTPNATITIAAAAHQSSTSSSTTSTSSSSMSLVQSSTSSSNGSPHPAMKKASSGVTETLPEQTFDGIVTKGSRVTVTIPSGAIGNDRDLKVINERWFSDDFKLLLKTVNTDPRFGVTTYELQNILQGEPAASLFQVPSDYTEGH